VRRLGEGVWKATAVLYHRATGRRTRRPDGAPRWLPWLLALVGMLLGLPSPRLGRLLEDDFHRLALTRPDLTSLARSPAELFVFVRGDVNENRLARSLGYLPWWTSPDLRIAFFRPVSGRAAADGPEWRRCSRSSQFMRLRWRAPVGGRS
jgi:hypothetical protein